MELAPERSLPADPAVLSEVRRYVDAAAEALGMPAGACFELKLAAHEAAANAVEHRSGEADAGIRVRATTENGALVLEVCGGGAFHTNPASPEEFVERGRGLALMTRLADRVCLAENRRGTVVALLKRCPA